LKFIAAIDQGTTSTRCIIFDKSGNGISKSQLEHEQIYPSPGWVEHDPMEILKNSKHVLESAIASANLNPVQIEAIGITNQRETTVLWDPDTGLPYCHAIVWQDTRTDKLCAYYSREDYGGFFKEKTGLPISTYFSGLKIKWLLENNDSVKEALLRKRLLFGNIDTWLIWNLTGGKNGGVHITDVTNASRTMLMNLKTFDWDAEILKLLDIPREILPEIFPSSQVYGQFHGENGSIPIAGDLGDQQAALFGQLCFNAGDAKNTYGTGCFLLMNTGNQVIPSSHGLLSTVGYQIGSEEPAYCLEGSVAITGGLVQWLRDNLKIIMRSSEIEALARNVPDNGGVYFVPAFSGLFAPYWHSNARGLLIGLTGHTTQAHIARAALEATAFQTREVLDAMVKDSNCSVNRLKVDGGMVKNGLLMQFQSDILNLEVVRPKVVETTALGAAYAAGLASGYWQDKKDLEENWKQDISWKPQMRKENRDFLYKKWKKAVQRSMDWID
jgi:glycerol kinase